MHETTAYQRVLALINFDGSDEKIARKALLLARMNRAQLLFLHLVEMEAALDGGFPASSPQTEAAALETAARYRLDFLAAQVGADEAECVACCAPIRQAFRQQLHAWGPDLVVSAHDHAFLNGAHDVLILGCNRQSRDGGLIARLMAWVSSSFQPAVL